MLILRKLHSMPNQLSTLLLTSRLAIDWSFRDFERGGDGQFAAVGDDAVFRRLVAVGRLRVFDLADNVHSFEDFAEHHVSSVQPASLHGGQEELRSVRVGSGVGHAQPSGAVMFEVEVLVGEFLSEDALAAGSVSAGEVSSLDHEVLDDAMEFGSLVSEAFGAGAEFGEVLGGLGDDFSEQPHHDAARILAPDRDVEIYLPRHLHRVPAQHERNERDAEQ